MADPANSPQAARPRATGPGSCDSCSARADDLVPVRRVYITPGPWEIETERVEVVDEMERWCFPCRTHYPHQPVEEA